jgi:hypothetical protein
MVETNGVAAKISAVCTGIEMGRHEPPAGQIYYTKR